MKVLKKILILLMFSVSLQADYWEDYNLFAKYMGYETDYYKAIALAKKEKKDLLFIMVNEGCPFCHRLIDKLLTKDGIREYIDKTYVKLIINSDKNKDFPKKLHRPFAPVTYIIEPESEQVVDEVDGWMEEEAYLWHL